MTVLVSNVLMRYLLCASVIVVAAGCSGGGGTSAPRPLPTPPRLGVRKEGSMIRLYLLLARVGR